MYSIKYQQPFLITVTRRQKEFKKKKIVCVKRKETDLSLVLVSVTNKDVDRSFLVNNRLYHTTLFLLSICYDIPSRQICRKSSVEECFLDDMALPIECRSNKNSLLQRYFLAILPTLYLLNVVTGRVMFSWHQSTSQI